MKGPDETPLSDRTFKYEKLESPVVFRLAWYAAAGTSGVRLTDYSEAESQVFEGKAMFTTKIDEEETTIRVWVDEAKTSVEIAVWTEDESTAKAQAEVIESRLLDSIEKYHILAEADQKKLDRSLVAKMCMDKIVYYILNNHPVSDIYYQVAHGREMMIKATEGEDLSPVALSTAGWLARIEGLPRDEKMPAELATELAKKSIEWKKQVHQFIGKYL